MLMHATASTSGLQHPGLIEGVAEHVGTSSASNDNARIWSSGMQHAIASSSSAAWNLERILRDALITKPALAEVVAGLRPDYAAPKTEKKVDRILMPDAPTRKRSRKASVPCRLVTKTLAVLSPTKPPSRQIGPIEGDAGRERSGDAGSGCSGMQQATASTSTMQQNKGDNLERIRENALKTKRSLAKMLTAPRAEHASPKKDKQLERVLEPHALPCKRSRKASVPCRLVPNTAAVPPPSKPQSRQIGSITSPPITPATKKSKTQAERQREYRLRQKQNILNNSKEKKKTSERKIEYQRQYRLKKKLKKAQNRKTVKPPKKTRADYQREYRLRKQIKAELNSGSTKLIPRQEARPSGSLPPVTTA